MFLEPGQDDQPRWFGSFEFCPEKRLKSDHVNRWLTLFANLSVVAGIVFLAYELRQNNELLRFEVEAITFENMVWGLEKAVEEPSFAELMFRVRSGMEISDEEAYRARAFYRRVFRGFQWEYQQASLGRLEIITPGRWADLIQENEYARAEWDWAKDNILTTDFVQYVEREILELEN